MSTETFIWNDELVKEFVITYNKIDKLIDGTDPIGKTISEWKQSKMPKQERVEVAIIEARTEKMLGRDEDCAMLYVFTNHIGKLHEICELEKIKEVVQKALNPTTDTNTPYTKEEVQKWLDSTGNICPPQKEEAVVKDWEILSYEFDNRIQVPNVEPYITMSNNFKNVNYSISRVKRLSDGVVFSVGDSIRWGEKGYEYTTTLKEFVIVHDRMNFKYDNSWQNDWTCDFLAAVNLTKLPTPTEQKKSDVLETKYMNSLQAYTEGFAQGVKHCERYGIPSHINNK